MPSAKEKDILAFIEDPTEENRNKIHSLRIPKRFEETVKAKLPDNMHLDGGSVLRYKNGQAPGSLKNIGPENGFAEGQNGRTGKKSIDRTSLREFYRAELDAIVKHPKTKQEMPLRELLPKLHVETLLRAFRNNSDEKFNRLLSEFRANVGEPLQTENRNINEADPYTRANVDQLIKLTKALLTRYELPQQAEIVSIDTPERPQDAPGATNATKDEVRHD